MLVLRSMYSHNFDSHPLTEDDRTGWGVGCAITCYFDSHPLTEDDPNWDFLLYFYCQYFDSHPLTEDDQPYSAGILQQI